MLYEQFYEEINAELQCMGRESTGTIIQQSNARIHIGSGEDSGIIFFNYKEEANDA